MENSKQYNPGIAYSLDSRTVVENAPFTFNVRDGFLPSDGDLSFTLAFGTPDWVKIDSARAEIFGFAPKVHHTKPFKINIVAANAYGSVTQSFILSVLCTDIVETMPEALEFTYTLRHQKYGFSHLHPYTPSLLEYVYTLYQLPEYRDAFNESLQAHAKTLNLPVKKQYNFSEFHEIIEKLNPNIEQHLRERLAEDNALLHETLSNEQLENLFRQGSQPLGVITIPIWNHLGAIEQYNWEDWQTIDTVLAASAHAVSRQHHLNEPVNVKNPTKNPTNNPINKLAQENTGDTLSQESVPHVTPGLTLKPVPKI